MSDNFGDVKVGCEEHGYTGRTACPWCEIERLRGELGAALKNEVHYAKRIEELEKESEWKAMKQLFCADYHIITDDQIDAAWEERHDGVVEGIMYIPASEIGITECENPRCQDGRHIETTHLPSQVCKACNGHGWVMKGDE